MNSRRPRAWAVCLIAALGFILAPATHLLAANGDRPNFIIMYIDDLGYSDLSVRMMDEDPESQSDFHQTPNVEKLAARGMRFSHGYAPAPTCTPSRKSIQFGKTPGRLGYTFVHDVLAMKRGLKWVDELSLADVVKAADERYITAHFGKGMASKERMAEIGYDVTDEHDIGPNGNFHGDYVDIPGREPLPENDPKRMASLEKVSLEFLREHAGERPFFMMISHYAVHVPHKARADLIEKYRNLPRGKYLHDDDYLDPSVMPKGRLITHWRLQYAAMVDQIDQHLGSLVAELEKAGELDNTYIIFTSDNGGGMKPNGSLSWGKAQLFEGGLRVPWIVAGPGVKAGVQCDVPINQWDLLPTFHELAGGTAELPDDLDGVSLRSVFEKGNDGELERGPEGMVFHYPCYFAPPLSVIRVGDYKLMKHLLTGEILLFNVVEDMGEKNNLAASMPEKAAELEGRLGRYLEEINAENVQDVYQARLEELDKFEAMARDIHKRDMATAEGKLTGAELEARRAKIQERLDNDLERFAKNRVEVEVYRTSSHWAGGPPQKK